MQIYKTETVFVLQNCWLIESESHLSLLIFFAFYNFIG